MASSGSISGSIKDGHYVVRMDWTQTKNLSANTSTIEAKIYLINDWSLSISGRSDNTISIDGTSQKFTSPAISSFKVLFDMFANFAASYTTAVSAACTFCVGRMLEKKAANITIMKKNTGNFLFIILYTTFYYLK